MVVKESLDTKMALSALLCEHANDMRHGEVPGLAFELVQVNFAPRTGRLEPLCRVPGHLASAHEVRPKQVQECYLAKELAEREKKNKRGEQRTLIQLHPPTLRAEALDMLIDIPPPSGLEVAVQLRHVVPRLGDAAQAHDGHDAVDALQGDGARRGEVLDTERHNLVGRLEVGGGDLPAEGRVLGWVGLDAVDFLDGGEVGGGEDCSSMSVTDFLW